MAGARGAARVRIAVRAALVIECPAACEKGVARQERRLLDCPDFVRIAPAKWGQQGG